MDDRIATLDAPRLRALNHHFVHAMKQGDWQAIASLTSDDFYGIDAGGNWIGKQQLVERTRQAPSTTGISYDDVRVRFFGTCAVLHGIIETDIGHDSNATIRYTAVYQSVDAQWKLIHLQETGLAAGIATPLHRGNAPPFRRWQGVSPAGDDLSQLYALNENYVNAYREADTAWYDAHLAHDYVVTQSDGTFNDRARALANFAKGSFAQFMQSFPVSDVRVRRFSHFALIHAENAYTRKDGKSGVDRYTDIWCKQTLGNWLCVAAHITCFRPPSADQ